MLPVSKAPEVDQGQRGEEGEGVEAEWVYVRDRSTMDSVPLTMEEQFVQPAHSQRES